MNRTAASECRPGPGLSVAPLTTRSRAGRARRRVASFERAPVGSDVVNVSVLVLAEQMARRWQWIGDADLSAARQPNRAAAAVGRLDRDGEVVHAFELSL